MFGQIGATGWATGADKQKSEIFTFFLFGDSNHKGNRSGTNKATGHIPNLCCLLQSVLEELLEDGYAKHIYIHVSPILFLLVLGYTFKL